MTIAVSPVMPHCAALALRRLVLLVFPAAIFLSASLLFWIEPLFSKMVLPVLGGSSAVWSVAMVVFQGLMLAGYLYAHLLTRYLQTRHAVLVHAVIMAAAALWLPIGMAAGFHAPPQHGLSLWLIALFLASIGLPFFALAANAPLLQAWFARNNSENAYLLYRASNLGSVLVLVAYPFLIEPVLGLAAQSRLWSIGYAGLVMAVIAGGALTLRTPALQRLQPLPLTHAALHWRDRLSWAALGFVPSGLLIAVTAHIATDVASGPYIWIFPLALYLLSFVLAFSDRPLLPARTILATQPFTTAALVVLFLWGSRLNWIISLAGHLAAFFTAAMVCQTELYRRRPAQESLTQFYAWLSFGGVLGGIFAALLAPQMFNTIFEYPLLTFAALLVRPGIWKTPRVAWLRGGAFVILLAGILAVAIWLKAIAAFVVAVTVLAAFLAFQGPVPTRLLGLAGLLLAVTHFYDPTQSIVLRARSFYGAYKIADLPSGRFRVLYQGTTAHGGERLRDDAGRPITSGRPERLAYYYAGGPYDDGIQAVRRRLGGRVDHVALIGLGIGALSCAAAPGEALTIYELDPMSAQIARNRDLFRSLSVCAPVAPVVIGDGRLTLRQARPNLGLILLDVFSSDSVPLHMLTREAFGLYKSRLAPHGAIVINLSNKNMQLADAVAASAAANGMVTAVTLGHQQTDSKETLHFRAEVVLVAQSADDLQGLKLGSDWHIVHPRPGTPTWTDDYSNVLSAILLKAQE
ncbi:MAG: fused MFS/spermidine synthase [Alphaproteobacteria bacterium]|nr:fused MFS/spermidine synthase [Alphaproteobacteria bacterium]